MSEQPQKLADALDTTLLKAVSEGVEVSDGNGGTIKVTAPAKYLEVAMKRLDQLGVLDPARDGTPAGELARRAKNIEARFNKLKLHKGPPPLEAESA